MQLQFFHVEDLCRFIEIIMDKKPQEHTFNVGNPDTVSINEWVSMCYEVVEKELNPVYVDATHEQRSYFSFYDYEYCLDVSKQQQLMPDTKDLMEGLRESYEWYFEHEGEVVKKPYIDYIDGM